MNTRWVTAGRVKSVHVQRRELRVAAREGCAYLVAGADWIWLCSPGAGSPQRLRMERSRLHAGDVICALTAGVAREAVAALRGAEVVVPWESLRPDGEGSWPVELLFGLEASSVDGAPLGKVVSTMRTRANDVIELETPVGARILLPVIPALLLDVNPVDGRLILADLAPYMVDDAD